MSTLYTDSECCRRKSESSDTQTRWERNGPQLEPGRDAHGDLFTSQRGLRVGLQPDWPPTAARQERRAWRPGSCEVQLRAVRRRNADGVRGPFGLSEGRPLGRQLWRVNFQSIMKERFVWNESMIILLSPPKKMIHTLSDLLQAVPPTRRDASRF